MPNPSSDPTPLVRTRVKLVACAALAGAGTWAGVSWWAVAVLLVTCAAIVAAVAVADGPSLVRALFFLPSPPQPVRRRSEGTHLHARLDTSGRAPAQPR
ncbi:hypothetical protein ACI2K4_22465 [Micromonospora sp. NPDC050397]|uniref:hypothetical protein n=1 Tax=Micromonospora sp. NPDC050397 TaxID=3364279 RepID=UPI00384FB008